MDRKHEDGITALKTVFAFLEQRQWSFTTTGQDPVTLRMQHKGEHDEWAVYLRYLIDIETLVCYSVFPVDAPPERRTAMMKLITRINITLTSGNFQMHLNDGEILLRTSAILTNQPLTEAGLQNLIDTNLNIMDRCFRPIMLALFEKCTIDDAMLLVDV